MGLLSIIKDTLKKIIAKETKETGKCLRVKRFSEPFKRDIIYKYTSYNTDKIKMYNIYENNNQIACIPKTTFKMLFVKI